MRSFRLSPVTHRSNTPTRVLQHCPTAAHAAGTIVGMTLDRDIWPEAHNLCPYCNRHPTEVVTDTITLGGVEQPGARVRRCTDPACEGRKGWPPGKDPDPRS
jgi:hypothetical protein